MSRPIRKGDLIIRLRNHCSPEDDPTVYEVLDVKEAFSAPCSRCGIVLTHRGLLFEAGVEHNLWAAESWVRRINDPDQTIDVEDEVTA